MAQPTAKILNVDDHEMCRYAISRLLENSNFRVTEAATGAEALRLARSERPDLVLLDVNLPDINGYEVCRRLKAEPATARIPVLHITASYLTGPDKARGLEAGADSYLTEPVEPEVLVATINAILRARRAEEAARTIAVEWEATFGVIRDGVALVDAEGRIQRANEAFARMVGRSSAELQGQIAYRLWQQGAQDIPFRRAFTSRHRETQEFELGPKLISVTVDPMLDEDGKPTGAVCMVSDITETRRLQEQFRESQKFETIGTLAAGVAHDYNNLLTSIMGNASLALAEQPQSDSVRERLEEVIRASQRAADLTKQLLAYSGKGRNYLQKAELSGVVHDTRKLIEAAVPKKVELDFQLASGLPPIEADLNQVQQVLLNLVSNAAEAIGDESGTIWIRTGAEGDQVFLEVQDTGCGMDLETKSRIFDPFFTTKFTGRGLGLAAVAGVIRGHRGDIQVTSAPGKGSMFRVLIPTVSEAAPRSQETTGPSTQTAAETSKATVLVVDDEQMVRRIAEATLQKRGHQVLLADNGLEAIQKVRNHPEISVVLLDLTMPVMGGEEAIDEILQEHPGIQVIVSTGYDQREAASRFAHKQVAGFLQKPYTSRQLGEKIENVLARKARRN